MRSHRGLGDLIGVMARNRSVRVWEVPCGYDHSENITVNSHRQLDTGPLDIFSRLSLFNVGQLFKLSAANWVCHLVVSFLLFGYNFLNVERHSFPIRR